MKWDIGSDKQIIRPVFRNDEELEQLLAKRFKCSMTLRRLFWMNIKLKEMKRDLMFTEVLAKI